MKADDTRRLSERKVRIDERLDGGRQWESERPVVESANLRYEISGRVGATSLGGIGLVHEFVRQLGLVEALDDNVKVLKRHFPYHESDHILNLTYNLMTGGTCIEDIERLRQDEAYLEALGAERVPDPTTAGDFLRRFDQDSLLGLMQAMDVVRPSVWAKLPKKEESAIKREMARMNRNFEGLVDMPDMPSIMFVVDVNFENIAVAEAERVKVPVVAIVDTNSDPSLVKYPIPGNDDAVKSIRIVVDILVEAIQSGLSQREAKRVGAGMQDVRNLSVQQFTVGTVPAGEREIINPAAPQQAAVEEATEVESTTAPVPAPVPVPVPVPVPAPVPVPVPVPVPAPVPAVEVKTDEGPAEDKATDASAEPEEKKVKDADAGAEG